MQRCYDYFVETASGFSKGIVLAETPQRAHKVILNMNEYKGLPDITITISNTEGKHYEYKYLGGVRITQTAGRVEWLPVDPATAPWNTAKSFVDVSKEASCIGHVRGDFGRSGSELWTSWFDHNPKLKTNHFRGTLQNVMNAQRKKGHVFHDLASLRAIGNGKPKLSDGSFLLTSSTDRYWFILRCIPRSGDYNFYLYCYIKHA